MTASLLLVHGDDSLGIDTAIGSFVARVGAVDRVELASERSPDDALLDRARVEAGTVGLFGGHAVVLRQPLRAAGRSTGSMDRLVALVAELPDGGALALAEERPSREVGRPPALLKRVSDAVRQRGGQVLERLAPRRNELRAWIGTRAHEQGLAIDAAAAALLADRIGGSVWETDIERGQQTRVADGELRKLALYAGARPIAVGDVDVLVADTRPASVFAVTNALDRRDPAAAADALERAIAEGQPVPRIVASLASRIADLIVTRELADAGSRPDEVTRRVARGNARVAERLVAASRRYRMAELEEMLRGLFETDRAIKSNEVDPDAAIAGWLGEFLLAATPVR